MRNGKTFKIESGDTILNAALSAGVVLEHSCKTGRCGTCKAQVDTGSTALVLGETGLSQAELDTGWILTCARSAITDVQLDIEDLGDIRIHSAKTLPCRIQSLERLSSDVVHVALRLPPNQQFDYHPGQYIDVIGKNGLRRSYSVANAPAADKLIELHIRQVENGAMSRYWFNEAKVNDLLRLNGPLGTFFLREVSGLDLVLLATGTGVAPIKAILEGLANSPPGRLPRSINVFWGGRVPRDLYWDPSSMGLALRYIPVLSRADESWSGERGHIQEKVLCSGIDMAQAAVYACGSSAMIDSARTQLVMAGLNARRYFADAFVSSS